MADTQTVKEFCASEGFSKATYYNLRAIGRGPDELVIGGLRRITAESRAAWRARMAAEPIVGGLRKLAEATKAA